MKSVILSVKPAWCAKIANKEKSLEVRKNRPKIETPFKCYIYCTLGSKHLCLMQNADGVNLIACCDWKTAIPVGGNVSNGKVIGEFICDNIHCFDVPYPAFQSEMDKNILTESCCTYYMLHRYAYDEALYGWHISDLKIYDKPRELSEFSRFGFNGMGYSKCICGNYSCNHFVNSHNYDEPPECEIDSCQLTRAPQSWCYVEGTT